MDKDEMKLRTKRFALSAIRLVEALPRTQTGQIIGRQLMRSATSVGANYRSACLARSRADFVSKLGIVAEEADESQYWIELLVESKCASGISTSQLMSEARQITSIVIAARKTARKSSAAATAQAEPGTSANSKLQIANGK